jgi:hypothetical protein
MGNKLFNYVIGNPPYQQEFTKDGNKTYAAPVYNEFMDAVDEVSEKVELIHPARFLFNAGSTPKAWNQKMLNDPHFKVEKYVEDATQVFPNTDIKGGVAVTYRDEDKEFGAIEVFTKYDELNNILHKVTSAKEFIGMDSIVVTRTAYRFTEKMHEDHPEARYKEDSNGNNIGLLSKGHDFDMSTNIFERIPQIFYDEIPDDSNKYIKMLGRIGSQRIVKYIRADYVNEPDNLYYYKVFMSSGNGNGQFGESLTEPIVADSGEGSTETFISIGRFNSKLEADFLDKYIKTKFCRAMIGVLKTTQHLTPSVWKCVPIQDFTTSSDIDWSQSIPEIDKQLYKKYGLSDEEINFIETHVKPMD